ncbi:NEDD8 ultimate buster 1-like isoform X1 [Acipenser oxyrinchus oxyrinchus]|uniref:NEDD8 ultimate buster 1-like isoform X1 n=1 Tax=Acipenser oxyrinchus oxyrinchus TaxID=40147 RepID=A0AAD8LTW5_ACIOX|nr:NEDD8 ultimate buster 1-like isoform X1 [Acipenser oxyrinchus oxyrinchus]
MGLQWLKNGFQGQTFYNCFKGQMAQEEYLQLKLKTCVRSDKAPYTTENNEAGQQAIKELAEKYAPNLNLNATEVESALEAVSSLTVKREKANETEGVATLEIALPKKYKQGSQRHYLETTLDITSNQLMAMISEKFGVGTNMKLFLSGKTVGAGKTLQEQGVKHNSKIMVLSLKESEEDKQKMAAEEKQYQIKNETITRTQKGFEILSERDGSMDPDSTPFLEITDQKGNPIKIPPAERKALILAMGLHEKGRALLKKKDYEMSLCLLLEADEQFSKCGSQLLNTVDNYAVLQLDIVWCYRALENLDYLENAKERLQKAESCFLKCYGEKQTRLLQIKGNSGREEVLFLRLYLLQGFLFFLRDEDKLAAEKVVKVEDMYMQLCVDPHQMTQLMALGYTEQEARLGLRACRGNLNEAAKHISQRREEKAKERQKRRKRVDDINTLREMGCSKRDAARALHDAEGDLDRAFQILLDNNRLVETTSNDTESSGMDSSNLVNEVLGYIPNHEEDYLDLNLEEESEVIAKLKSYLETKHQAPC